MRISFLLFLLGVAVILAALCMPLTTSVQLGAVFSYPSWEHWLGTDQLGRDFVIRLLQVFRDEVVPVWVTITLSYSAAIVAALGFLGLESSLGRLVRFILGVMIALLAAIPAGIWLFVLAVRWGEISLWGLHIGLAAIFFVRIYQHVYQLYLRDARLGYWQAHEALGGPLRRRIWQYGLQSHWLQDLSHNYVFCLQSGLILEASVSYLGFGIQEPHASFGNILASQFYYYLKGQFWSLVIVVVAFVYCLIWPQILVSIMSRLRTYFTRRFKPSRLLLR